VGKQYRAALRRIVGRRRNEVHRVRSNPGTRPWPSQRGQTRRTAGGSSPPPSPCAAR
jgi:hypothetical protein